ncbi:ribonuclease P protein subunit p30 isoform X4 [Mustela lutreola]|uniref:ribonuclease P protein subunit p30 isoform X4 n=1 Tax=Mustela lutreola TaxID=9666 RepID=UPI0027971533|nr:ribonuclease P protein subunit p30 isoform X4 [Mustela lutreola]
MAVFADLDLRAGSDLKALRGLVENAAHLGYSVVAINHVVEFKEKKQEIEKPVAVSELFTTWPIVQGKSRPIKVLTRLTIIVSDPSHCNVLRATSSRVRLYDIVAVFPKTEKLFHAIDRGVGFELIYSPAIKDSTMRRYTISNALNLMQVCKGKNVILSSAAERPLEIRGPYDVANLGLLFGLSESDAKAAVSTNCRAVLLHGEHCPGLMELTLPKEAWEALPHHPLPPTQFGLWLVPDAGHYHPAFWPPQRD